MELVSLTGWPVRYITHHIGLGTLLLIFGSAKEKSEKPTGLFADPNSDLSKLSGLKYKEK